MRRRLFGVVSAISLLLCLASVVLWVRSYLYLDLFEMPRPDYPDGTRISGPDIAFNEGQARLAWRRWLVFNDEDSDRHFWRSLTGEAANRVWQLDHGLILPRNYHHFGPFSYGYEYDRGSGTGVWFFSIPLWFAFASFTAYPTWRLVRAWRQEGHDLHCRRCGYNLHGNTSGVCPECGTPVPKAPADKSPRHA
jgi:hypothetical protein